MILFEKDGLSFFISTDLKTWSRKSHFKGLFECPDFFELPIDGDPHKTKWVLHGGSSTYYIGSFDGETFTSESAQLRYAEGANARGDDALYAAQSFAEMPDGRRVQIAWGRIKPAGMPFNQMMLFPTEFKLVTTPEGLRMRATPIAEIEKLRRKPQTWTSLTTASANQALDKAGQGPLDVRLSLTLAADDSLFLQYRGRTIANIHSADLGNSKGSVEVLIDKGVAEIFVNEGARYITTELTTDQNGPGLQLAVMRPQSAIDRLEISAMRSIWSVRGLSSH